MRLTFHIVTITTLVLCCFSFSYADPLAEALLDELATQSNAQLHVSYHDATGKVRFLSVDEEYDIPQPYGIDAKISSEMAARNFLEGYGELFGIRDHSEELTVKRVIEAERGRSFVKFRQVYNGIPVIAGELVVQMDSKKNIKSVNGEISPDPQLDTIPAVDSINAEEKALDLVSDKYDIDFENLATSEPELWIYNPVLLKPGLNYNSLVWRIEVTASDFMPVWELVLVDAHNGSIALHFNQVNYAKYREIYDNLNNNLFGLPGNGPVRKEGQPVTGITDVDNAYTYLGDTYDFYFNTHGRDSIDNNGMDLIATVRFPFAIDACGGACWYGLEMQMIFGQGFTAADDVVAHELTHGVTQYESGLFYYWQSGAINESLSDIWGEFVDLTNSKGTDTSSVRWLLGEDSPFGVVRDMSNPRDYNQPDRMALFDCEDEDNGGVHTNSGIGNKAAYLIVDGDNFNGKTVTGIGITKTAKIYYEAQTKLLTEGSDYPDLYDSLQQACSNLIGTEGITNNDCQQVKNAVDSVKMNLQPSCASRNEAPICTSGSPHDLFFDSVEDGGKNWYHASLTGYDAWGILENPLFAVSGTKFIYGYNRDDQSDSFIRMKKDVLLPEKSFLHFKHYHKFDDSRSHFDGGVVEYSINGGNTWQDAGGLFTHNGYNGTIQSIYTTEYYKNPLQGSKGFVSDSYGLYSSRLNLNSLTGKWIRFRFRIGTDASIDDIGWLIDDIRIYYTLAGIGFYAYKEQISGTSPVYRFNTGKGTHFYTISETEKNNVLNNLPSYTLAGIGFYAYRN
jgi:Zn-dependent metalloprotease